MTQPISDQYFYTGAFTSAGPEAFASYTCLGCGTRLKTWNTFDAHRRDCSGRMSATGPVFGAGLMERLLSLGSDELPLPAAQPLVGVPATLSLAATPLAATSLSSVDNAEAEQPLAEHDPFLDAPPAALVLLERWRREEEQQLRQDAA